MNTEPTNQEKRLSLLTSREEITGAVEQINQLIAAQAEKARSLLLVIEAIDHQLEEIPEEAPVLAGQN